MFNNYFNISNNYFEIYYKYSYTEQHISRCFFNILKFKLPNLSRKIRNFLLLEISQSSFQ